MDCISHNKELHKWKPQQKIYNNIFHACTHIQVMIIHDSVYQNIQIYFSVLPCGAGWEILTQSKNQEFQPRVWGIKTCCHCSGFNLSCEFAFVSICIVEECFTVERDNESLATAACESPVRPNWLATKQLKNSCTVKLEFSAGPKKQ